MLYDILIIDDDFSGESVLDNMDTPSKDIDNAWKLTIMPLYFDLIRDNLKVMWTTGEVDDLNKLNDCQMSSVEHIICDLHLSGIKPTSDSKAVISKIMGILKRINKQLENEEVYFLVNSKYVEKHLDIEAELQKELQNNFANKYIVEVFKEKNAITPQQKQKLLDASLLSYTKEQIIKKHLEMERCLGDKIEVKNEEMKELTLKELSFNSKHKIVKKYFKLNGYNTKIKIFNELRNIIAHSNTNLDEINESDYLKSLIKELNGLNKFSDLIVFIQSVDRIISVIKEVNLKNGCI